MKMKMKMTKAGEKKMGKVMSEYGKGKLHSGKGGPVVKSQKQAVAIGLSSAKKAMQKKG
jgi:hypothetical protein